MNDSPQYRRLDVTPKLEICSKCPKGIWSYSQDMQSGRNTPTFFCMIATGIADMAELSNFIIIQNMTWKIPNDCPYVLEHTVNENS